MTTIAERHYNLKSEKSVPVCLRAGKLWGPLLIVAKQSELRTAIDEIVADLEGV